MSKLEKFEKRKRLDFEKEKRLRELQEEYGIDEPTPNKRMYQYSKVLTTIILIFTLIVNSVYFFILVPQSGHMLITDAAMENAGAVLKIWNTGTIVFFCGYFAKALFETKFEAEYSSADGLIDKVTEKVNETIDVM